MPEEPVTKVEFSALLKKKKMKKLDQDLIKELCNRFATKNQNVDCVEMRRSYMRYYPDTVLPPPPPKKKGKKGKKGKGKKIDEVEVPVQPKMSTSEKQPEEQVVENENKCAVPVETVPDANATTENSTAPNTQDEGTNENQTN